MATAFSAVTPGATALVCTGVQVTASADTINGNDVNNGGVFIVTVGNTPTDVSFTDPGHTPAGTAAGTPAATTVAANTSKAFGRLQLAGYINSSGLIGVNFTSTTGATAMFVA
jgi:hypothetical protein